MSRKIGAFEKRIHEIDFIRGAMMLLVIMDHVFWYLKSYGYAWYNATGIEFWNTQYQIFNFYWTSAARIIIRQVVLFGFVFVSGISCAFSKNNWKRAGLMLLVGFVLTIVTSYMQAITTNPNQTFAIHFNVIHVLGWSCLIYCFVQNRSWKISVAMMLIFFLFTFVGMPAMLAVPGAENAFVPPVFPIPYSIITADWMPLFPYICYFFAGAAITRFLYPTKESIFPRRYNFERPFCFVGRHAIWVYMGHEPLLVILYFFLNMIVLSGVH